ncbi:MAG: type II toxin-antitoxin system VapC family toxin [Candidatus Woesearchaeota archaeon]|nr:type II toxin-antitoxin system VapC family toxin [Candidatus Woesearchaeota archaeon]
MNLTIDTSVLVDSLVPPRRGRTHTKQTKRHSLAKAIMQDIEDGDVTLYIPSAALVEVAAVCARLTKSKRQGYRGVAYLQEHGIVLFDDTLLESSIELGAQVQTSGFDTVFLACAKATNATLITNDKGMHAAAKRAKIPSRLLSVRK